MEKEKCSQKETAVNLICPLRMSVSSIVRETLENGTMLEESGLIIRSEVEMFMQCNKDSIPSLLPVGPNFILNTKTVMLARAEKFKIVVSSPAGWVVLHPTQLVTTIEDQADLLTTWFTHSGLILNSLERNLNRK